MPVFLFATVNIPFFYLNLSNAIVLFLILHLLVYPSSNAFNSIQDRDEGSIGLIEKPLPIHKELNWTTIALDLLAVLLCLTINLKTTCLIIIYVIASRLYSWRKIRLKKFAIIGFLTVFICQGFLVYFMVQFACNITLNKEYNNLNIEHFFLTLINNHHLILGFIASLFIGSIYPISQIYQHEQDKKDGVNTISAKLGFNGTFIFSGIQFILASGLFSYLLIQNENYKALIIYSLFQLPVISYFLFWFYKVIKDNSEANFKNTMKMNIISAVCMNACFIILLIIYYKV
jgi:1,4-dihydroxy-2-naphthoate octaprenyltransferase